ncbi:MAG TPA: Spy/CpxP family protein refolding chaperone [Burkholderiales bacterium]|nr:Spy/CpxP family protein refolding chaperone [Burkholderiales bacterium]
MAEALLAASVLCLASTPAGAQSSSPLGKILGNVLGGSSGNSGSGQQKSRSKKQDDSSAAKPAAAEPAALNTADEEDRRLKELKTALKLTPEQEPAWQAYEASVKALAYDLARPAAPSSAPDQTAPQKVDQKVDAARSRLASMQQISDSAKRLYDGLGDEQKAVANRLLDTTIPPFALPNARTASSTQTQSGGRRGSEQSAGSQTPAGTWYYCDSAKTYYPYVQSCAEGWRAVAATPQPTPR